MGYYFVMGFCGALMVFKTVAIVSFGGVCTGTCMGWGVELVRCMKGKKY
jgi:hypothetical protein